MRKTFPQEGSNAFLNLKSLHYAEQKKLHHRVLTECFEKHFEKTTWFFGFSKNKLFGTLPPLLNKPIGFITKLLEKQFKDCLSKVFTTSRCRNYALRFLWYMHNFY